MRDSNAQSDYYLKGVSATIPEKEIRKDGKVREGDKNEEAKSNSDASNNSTIRSKTLTIFKNPYIKICITTPKLCQKDLMDIATMIP